jgi:formate--tetrahydrofolate ligase
MKALQPNLVQTLENNPAFIHGGPFANIAHGCNSVVATKTALKLADYVVTEAGFGADLGAEKFFDIKCRSAGLKPAAAVVVATIRALKMHGGVGKDALGKPDVEALKRGCANLGRHIDNVKQFGVPVVVGINHFTSDTAEEVAAVKEFAASHGVEAILCEHWAKGSEGTTEIAEAVVKLAQSGAAQFAPLYDDSLTLWEKINTVATRIYRAEEAVADKRVRDQLKAWDEAGYSRFPVCMAKTQYSFSTDPNLKGAPLGHVVPVREVRLSAGAGFVVAICGEIMTMPGLPKVPSAETIRVDAEGLVQGLF